MKLPELLRRTGISARQVRYLITEKLVPPPTGGRAHAFYGENHVKAIRRYLRLKDLGLSPASIRVLLEARKGVPFPVGDGVTLVVAPELVASGKSAEPFVASIERTLRKILRPESDRGSPDTDDGR